MSMSERVACLRKLSLDTHPCVSAERAVLMTDFYKTRRQSLSVQMERALSFQYLMEHKTIYIGENELIVGEKGPSPKASPTYPELCCHSLEDLDILNSREKVSFDVSPTERAIYAEEIIPFWDKKSMRRPDLAGNESRMAGLLRSRYLYRIYGTALPRPYSAG